VQCYPVTYSEPQCVDLPIWLSISVIQLALLQKKQLTLKMNFTYTYYEPQYVSFNLYFFLSQTLSLSRSPGGILLLQLWILMSSFISPEIFLSAVHIMKASTTLYRITFCWYPSMSTVMPLSYQ
jgi:uncharacterized membrane protein YhdT